MILFLSKNIFGFLSLLFSSKKKKLLVLLSSLSHQDVLYLLCVQVTYGNQIRPFLRKKQRFSQEKHDDLNNREV